MSEAAASLLLSPLSLYTWSASTLVRLVLSVPALVVGALYWSLLLCAAWPLCVATMSASVLLTCLYGALYLLHLALVLTVVAIVALMRHKMADGESSEDEAQRTMKKTSWSRRRMLGFVCSRAER